MEKKKKGEQKKLSKRNYWRQFLSPECVCVCAVVLVFSVFSCISNAAATIGADPAPYFFSSSKCVSREMLYICVTASCCRVESLHWTRHHLWSLRFAFFRIEWLFLIHLHQQHQYRRAKQYSKWKKPREKKNANHLTHKEKNYTEKL